MLTADCRCVCQAASVKRIMLFAAALSKLSRCVRLIARLTLAQMQCRSVMIVLKF